MKIINEKGKLFGIINIVDLIVLVVIVLLIIGGTKLFRSPEIEVEEDVKGEQKEALITLEVENAEKFIVDGLVVGDNLYNDEKETEFGKIIDKKTENQKEKIKDSDGNWVYRDIPDSYKVIFTIEAKAEDTPKAIRVGDSAVRVGGELVLKNKKVRMAARVVEVKVE